MSSSPSDDDDDKKNASTTTTQQQQQYQQTQAQMDAIEQEIKATQPLISDLKSIEELKLQYTSSDDDQTRTSFFLQGIESLIQQNYKQIRMVRGDGNCYYRAFLYRLCEKLLQSKKDNESEFKRIQSLSKFWDLPLYHLLVMNSILSHNER